MFLISCFRANWLVDTLHLERNEAETQCRVQAAGSQQPTQQPYSHLNLELLSELSSLLCILYQF